MNTYQYILDFRNQEVGGAVTSGYLFRVENDFDNDWNMRLPEFTIATKGKRLLILVHGYNNSRSIGRSLLVRFSSMLANAGNSDVMLCVLWPGDGWAKALTYPFEGLDADDTANALFKWITTNVASNSRIAFVGHSLGCRVVMNAALQLERYNKIALDRICLMAPAIDNNSLGSLDKNCYKKATLAIDRLAVLASEEDLVLQLAYPMGDLLQSIFYNEHWGRALGRTGPVENDPAILNRIEQVPKSKPNLSIGHGDYLDIDPEKPMQTKAQSEKFVLQFLDRVPNPNWPAQR